MIDFSIPLSELLREKAKYHKEQIAFHKLKLDEINALLATGSGVSTTLPFRERTMTVVEHTVKKRERAMSYEEGLPIISQDIVKPLVIEFLKSHEGKQKTTDIYDYIKVKKGIHDEPRRPWVTAISLALNTLSKGKNPKVIKTETTNGNVREYEWIEWL